jgi:hypothetical protein
MKLQTRQVLIEGVPYTFTIGPVMDKSSADATINIFGTLLFVLAVSVRVNGQDLVTGIKSHSKFESTEELIAGLISELVPEIRKYLYILTLDSTYRLQPTHKLIKGFL